MSVELVINPCEWCAEAEIMLAEAVPNASVADLKAQTQAGAMLFSLSRGDEAIGYYILRIDDLVEHSEGVIIAAATTCTDFDMVLQTLPVIEQQFKGCKFVRIHTARPGLVKKLVNSGYKPLEFVMIKGLE